MAKFTFKPKQSLKDLPLLKKKFNYKRYLSRGYSILTLGLLIYIAYKLN